MICRKKYYVAVALMLFTKDTFQMYSFLIKIRLVNRAAPSMTTSATGVIFKSHCWRCRLCPCGDISTMKLKIEHHFLNKMVENKNEFSFFIPLVPGLSFSFIVT